MGLLDEAIREHLDLKRQHGANEDDLARQEAEALGPVTEEDMSGPEGSDADGSSAEREAGSPFDRVAESELAGEPEESSFDWSGSDSDEVEVPPFVPAEPASDARPEEVPEPVDMPTQAFSAVESPLADEEDPFSEPDSAGPLEKDPLAEDLDEAPASAEPETRLLASTAETEEPFEPELVAPEPESEPAPLEAQGPPAEETPVEPSLDIAEPPESVPTDLGPVEDYPEAVALSGETEEPLSEPEPLEPYPLGSVEPALEDEPPAAAQGLSSAPSLLGDEHPIGPDPAAEQGSPPGLEAPPEDDLGPVTQAWSIESEPGFGAPPIGDAPGFAAGPGEDDLGPPEIPPVDEQPVFEPLSDAEDGPDDLARAVPTGADTDLERMDADLDPPSAAVDEPPRQAPVGARGFFEETEEHETLWEEEGPGADPDFEN